jgi:predicted MFS family arabinose efflux permease
LQPSTGAADARETKRIVGLVTIAAFASSAAMRVCDPMLPELAAEFGVGLPAAAGVITGFAISYALLQLVIGPLGDRYGKFLVIRLATTLAALASLGCAIASGLDWLVSARVLAGGVGGAIMPVAFAWIGDEVPYEQRQPVLARVMGGALLGVICGHLIGGIFVDTVGWRWAFAALALVFAAVSAMMWRSPAGRRTPAQPPAAGALRPAALLRDYAAILRPRWSRWVVAVVLVEGALFYGALAFVPSALHARFGIPLWQAAFAAAIVGAGGYLYTMMASRLIARLGERRLAAVAGACVGAALLAIGLAPAPAFAVAACLLLGVGFYGFHNTLQVHGTQLSTTHRSMGMALFALALFAGQSVGVAAASTLAALAGFPAAFGCAALAFLLLAAAFVRSLGVRASAAPG